MCKCDEKIKAWIEHHNFLFVFVDRINETCSLTFLLYFGTIILSLCVQLYTITTKTQLDDMLKSCLYTAAVFFQFIVIYSIPSQMLTDEADNTVDSIWLSKWYESSTSMKFYLKQIILRSQRSVCISVGKISIISLSTCFATTKTILSYYMFLRTMSGNNK
nr:odorant receptor [Semanotus bifasciatus]